MKFSEAMLKGYKKVDGRQYIGDFASHDNRAVCALGAINLALHDEPHPDTMPEVNEFDREFYKAWRVRVVDLNDHEGLPWEHIYGMAVAAGL